MTEAHGGKDQSYIGWRIDGGVEVSPVFHPLWYHTTLGVSEQYQNMTGLTGAHGRYRFACSLEQDLAVGRWYAGRGLVGSGF
jgi:hypothetical protein